MKKIRSFICLVTATVLIMLSSIVYAGNNVPSTTTTLPYYSSKTKIYEYTYTAKKFKPTSTGEMWMCFSGQCAATSPVTSVTIKVMSGASSTFWSTGVSGSSFPKTPQKHLTGMNTSTYYFGYVSKNNTSMYMHIKFGFGTSASEASNYTF